MQEVPYNDGQTEDIVFTFPNQVVSDVPCNNLQFGDPIWGYKKCFCDGTDSNKYCAIEGQACSCDPGKTVYYGAEDTSGNLDTSQNYRTQVAESIKFLDTFRSCGYTFQLANCLICQGANCFDYDCSLLEFDSTFNNYDENQMHLTLKAQRPTGVYKFNLITTMTPHSETAQVSKTVGPFEITKKIAMTTIGDTNATICVDSTQETIRYGFATSHFEKYTGDLMRIGNCRLESNNHADPTSAKLAEIDSNGVLTITQDMSSKITTYTVTITCFDLDDSTSPPTYATKDFQLTVVNVDVLQSSVFDSDINQYFRLTGSTDENFIPKLYLQGLIEDSTTQIIMDKCNLEFPAQVSETDETWPPDFKEPNDLHASGGNLQLKGTSDHLRKSQTYQIWIKQKALVYECACIGIVKGFNDGTTLQNGHGSYCSDTWNQDPSWCFVSPNLQCDGSKQTVVTGWESKISWVLCPQVSNNQALIQKQVESLRGPFTLLTYSSCKDGIIQESPINTNQKVDVGSQEAFFQLEQFFCDSIINNEGDDIRYSFTFLDHDYATPLTQEQIDNIKQFQYLPRAYVQAKPRLEFSENRFTLEQCKEICLNDPECLAFEYGVDYGSQESQNQILAPTKLEKGKQYKFYVDDNGTTKVLASKKLPNQRKLLMFREKGYINIYGVDVYNSEVFEVVDAMDGDSDSISLQSLADCQNFENECGSNMCCDYYESRESSRGDFYLGVSANSNSYFWPTSEANNKNNYNKKVSFKVYINEDQTNGLTTIQLSPNQKPGNGNEFMTVDGFYRFWFEVHGEKTHFNEGDCNIKTQSSPIIYDRTGSKNLDLYIIDQSQKWIYANQQTGLVTKSPLDTTIVKAYQVYIYIEDATRPNPNFRFIGPYILNVTCDNNQIIPSSVSQDLVFDASLGYLIYQNDFSSEQGLFELNFLNFSTSNQYCPISKYNILESLQSFAAHSNLTGPLFTNKGMNVKINTTECKTFQFWIHAQDNYGNQAFSNKVKVSVICPQQVFTNAIMIVSDIKAVRNQFQVGESGLLMIDHFREATFGFKAQKYVLTTDFESTTPNLQSPGCQSFMTSNVPGIEQSNGQIGFQIDTSLLQNPCRVRIFGQSLIDPTVYAFTQSTSIQVTCGSEKIQVDSSISNPEQLLFELGAKIPLSLSPYNLDNHWKLEKPVFTTSSEYCPITDFILDPSCSPGVRAKMSKVTMSDSFPQTLEFDTSQAYSESICIQARTEKVIGLQPFVIQIYVGSLDQFNISQSEQQEQYVKAQIDGMKLQIIFSTEIVTYETFEQQEEVVSRILDIKSISGLDESLQYKGKFTFSDSNARKLSLEAQKSDDLNSSLAFEWSLTDYTSQKLEISLKFSEQDQISANPLVYDKLQIQFKEDMIVDLSTFTSYPEESYEPFTMEIIPKPSESDRDLADSLVRITTNIAAGVLGSSFLLGFSNVQLMKQLWQLLSNVYLGLLLSVIVLNLPMNARAFVDSLSQIHQISVFQSHFKLYERLDISKTQYKSLGYAKLGFESLNFIQNIEAMFVKLIGFLTCLVVVKLSMIVAVRYYRKSFCLKIGAIANKKQLLPLLMQMTFKFIQTFCMPIFLCSLHQVEQLKSSELTKADKFSIFLAVFSLCCLVILQIYILRLVTKYRKKISLFAFQKKYEFIFQKQRMFSVSLAIFPCLQMVRQMIQSCILFYMDKQVTIAIHLSMLLTLFMLGYILTVNPFETKKQQLIMIFNEISIYLITILYLSFISSFRQERSLGLIFIVFFLANFGINLILLVIEGSKKIPQSIQNIVTKVQQIMFKVKRELWLKNLGEKALKSPNDKKIQEEYLAASKVVKDAKLKEKMEQDLKDFDAKIIFLCHNQLPVRFLKREKSNSLIVLTRSLSYNPLFETGVKSMECLKDFDNGKHSVMFDQFYKSKFDQRLYDEMYDIYLYKKKLGYEKFASIVENRQNNALGKLLEEQGFYFIRIQEDGNCGPRCVSVRLYGHEDYHLKIRTETNTFMDEEQFKKIKGDESQIGQWLTPKQFKRLKAFRKRQFQMWSPETRWTQREIRSAALHYDIPIICFSVNHGSTGYDRLYPARTEQGRQREILYMFHHDNHFTVLLHPSQLKLMLFMEKKGLVVKKFEFKTYREEEINKILIVDQILGRVESKFQDQADYKEPSQDKKQEKAKDEWSDLIAQPTREQKIKSKLSRMKQKVQKTKASIKRDKSQDLHEITELSEEQFVTDRKDLKQKCKNKQIQDGSMEFEDEPNHKAHKIKKKQEKSKDKKRKEKKHKKSKSKIKIPGKWYEVRDELDKHLGIVKKLRKMEKKLKKKKELEKSSSSSSFEEKYFNPMAVRYPDDYFEGDNNAKQDFLAEHTKYQDRLYEHIFREEKRIEKRMLKEKYLQKKEQKRKK